MVITFEEYDTLSGRGSTPASALWYGLELAHCRKMEQWEFLRSRDFLSGDTMSSERFWV